MKPFKEYLVEAAPPLPLVHFKSAKIGTSTSDHEGGHFKVSVSGDKVVFETPDGRQMVFTKASDLIALAGLKDGQFAESSSFDAFNGETAVKYSKSSKMIQIMGMKLGGGNPWFIIDGNKNWKDLQEGGWYSYAGGRPGLARYKIKEMSGADSGIPRPGEEIEYELPGGGKESGTVVDMNGASKLLNVKNEKGKKVKVSMYIK